MDADQNGLKARLLVASNGHGEDDIACKVLACLLDADRNRSTVDAWPMVALRDGPIASSGSRPSARETRFLAPDLRRSTGD